jgi:hypothetical protein
MAKPRNGEDQLAHDIFWHRQIVTILLESWEDPKLRPLLLEEREEILADCRRLIDCLTADDKREFREMMAQRRRRRLRSVTL